MKNMEEFIKNDNFANYLGIKFLNYGDGIAEAEMSITNNHKNSFGTVHGGAIYALADSVFAVASNSRDGLAMAINVSISYFKAVNDGKLIARAKEISLTNRLATYLIEIFDDINNLVALFQGTVYRKL